MHHLSTIKKRIGALSAMAVAVVLSCAFLVGCSNSDAENREILKEMENRSVDEAQSLIFKRADEKVKPILEQAAADGFLEPDASRTVFNNCVVIGDSVTYMGFLAGYLTEDEVAAYYSVSLKTCDEYVQQAIDIRPARIIFNFGTNDMVLFGGDANEFAQMYLERCEWVKKELPNVQIYIASTMSPTEETMKDNPGMVYADQFNRAVSAMCAQTDRVTYVETDFLVDRYPQYRAEDGIHFQDQFYGYWFAVVGKAIYQ